MQPFTLQDEQTHTHRTKEQILTKESKNEKIEDKLKEILKNLKIIEEIANTTCRINCKMIFLGILSSYLSFEKGTTVLDTKTTASQWTSGDTATTRVRFKVIHTNNNKKPCIQKTLIFQQLQQQFQWNTKQLWKIKIENLIFELLSSLLTSTVVEFLLFFSRFCFGCARKKQNQISN